MPKVSIVITTHNRPQLLARAIDSARASGSDVEVVVVDDASSDETAKICQSFRDLTYVRVERNQGVAGARNIGLAASSGEYVGFLDDDDVRLISSLDRQIAILEQNSQVALVYGLAIPEDPNGRQHEPYPSDCPQGDIFWELLTRNFIPCGSAVFRRECLSRVGLLDDASPGIDDWDLWVRIAEIYPIAAIEMPVMIWRQSTPSSGQGSSPTVDLIALSRKWFRAHWLKLPRLKNASRAKQREAWRSFSRNVSEHLVWEAFNALGKGRLGHARKSALTALRLHPAGLLGVLQRWTSTSTLVTLLASAVRRDELASTKAHFKRVRSSKTGR